VRPPAIAGELDDPSVTESRRALIRDRAFLRRTYDEWYRSLVAALPDGPGRVLEIGAGAGFLDELLPDVLRADILPLSTLDIVLDAGALPIGSAALRGIVMVNVLHHLKNVRAFLLEAARCVRPGGVVAAVEPWLTCWSRLVYRWLHHEPCDARASWHVVGGGPLSGGNSALPWILFARDRDRFAREFPMWTIASIDVDMPVAYCLSGGLSKPVLMPGAAYPWVRGVERTAARAGLQLGMFARIVLVRGEAGSRNLRPALE
jgi:SAM-dependent methyltransferase